MAPGEGGPCTGAVIPPTCWQSRLLTWPVPKASVYSCCFISELSPYATGERTRFLVVSQGQGDPESSNAATVCHRQSSLVTWEWFLSMALGALTTFFLISAPCPTTSDYENKVIRCLVPWLLSFYSVQCLCLLWSSLVNLTPAIPPFPRRSRISPSRVSLLFLDRLITGEFTIVWLHELQTCVGWTMKSPWRETVI